MYSQRSVLGIILMLANHRVLAPKFSPEILNCWTGESSTDLINAVKNSRNNKKISINDWSES
jgi:hypothetical protein